MVNVLARDYSREFAKALARMGTPGTFGRAKDAPGTPGLALKFLMKHPGLRDDAIVNSYGINAQIITLPPLAEFLDTPPEKFDWVIEAGTAGKDLPYVFDSVVRKEFGGVLIAWTAFVRGKGA